MAQEQQVGRQGDGDTHQDVDPASYRLRIVARCEGWSIHGSVLLGYSVSPNSRRKGTASSRKIVIRTKRPRVTTLSVIMLVGCVYRYRGVVAEVVGPAAGAGIVVVGQLPDQIRHDVATAWAHPVDAFRSNTDNGCHVLVLPSLTYGATISPWIGVNP
jgi:hypothetical protein